MTLVLNFECFGFEDRLGFFLSQILKGESITFSLCKEENKLRLYLEADCEILEQFTQKLSSLIPYSLFGMEVDSEVVSKTQWPQTQEFAQTATFSYCPECLNTLKENTCKVCGKLIPNISKEVFETIYSKLVEGKSIRVTSQSGEHRFSLKKNPRVYCLDLQKILEVCSLSSKELQVLASYEKPVVRVKANPDFGYREIKISLAHDFALLELFMYLKEKGVDFLFHGDDETCDSFLFSDVISNPCEVIVLENDRFVLLQSPTLPLDLQNTFQKYRNRDKAFLSTIIEENQIQNQNILNFYFSQNEQDVVCLYNAQTQWFNEVMKIELPASLFSFLDEIKARGENQTRLIQNYAEKFPTLLENDVSFVSLPQNFFGIWEIARIILQLSENPLFLATSNLHQRGVAIDYRFTQDSVISQKFDLVSCICGGMSFRLAGVEESVIALGYIESFSLFPSKLYLAVRDLVRIDGISFCGDLLQSKMIGDFLYKNNRQTPIYRNINFPLLYP